MIYLNKCIFFICILDLALCKKNLMSKFAPKNVILGGLFGKTKEVAPQILSFFFQIKLSWNFVWIMKNFMFAGSLVRKFYPKFSIFFAFFLNQLFSENFRFLAQASKTF